MNPPTNAGSANGIVTVQAVCHLFAPKYLRGVFEIRRDQLADVGDHRKHIGETIEGHDEDQPRHREDIKQRVF